MSAQRIEADLRACTDSFVNLVRAARIGDESAASKKRKCAVFITSYQRPLMNAAAYQCIFDGRHLGRLMCSHRGQAPGS